MPNWTKQAPIEPGGRVCNCCDQPAKTLPLEARIAVGFGCAQVYKDGDVIFDEQQDRDNFHQLAEFEEMAKLDPDHDWKVLLHGPLHGETYQRHAADTWVLIEKNEGFA